MRVRELMMKNTVPLFQEQVITEAEHFNIHFFNISSQFQKINLQ